MLICKYCQAELDTMLELMRHIKNQHPKANAQPQPAVGIKPWPFACPVCGYPAQWYGEGDRFTRTVCNRCLCIFILGETKPEIPPPEKCAAELAGWPCPRPSHKEWHRTYQEVGVETTQG